MTTIETDEETSANIKLFCDVKKMKLKDFVKWMCKNDEEFSGFIKKFRRLNL